jgi:hypothetical protein
MPLPPGPFRRRIGYHLRPRLRRETCKRCWRENPVGFSLPDEVWRACVPARHLTNVLCLNFFAITRLGWSVEGCEFYPVPGATTCSSPRPPWTCTRCILRLSLVWCTARGSRWWASESSSGTSATCRERPLFASATVRPSALPAPPLDDSTTEAIPTGYSGQLLPLHGVICRDLALLVGPALHSAQPWDAVSAPLRSPHTPQRRTPDSVKPNRYGSEAFRAHIRTPARLSHVGGSATRSSLRVIAVNRVRKTLRRSCRTAADASPLKCVRLSGRGECGSEWSRWASRI